MFEQEKDQLIKIIIHRTAEGQSDVAIRHILAADIPLALKTYFRADVEAMLQEEQYQARKKSRFVQDNPEIRILQEQVNSLHILHYSYPKTVYHDRVADCVHLLIHFLECPQATLLESIFEKNNVVTRPTLESLLRYFEPYGYLRILLLRYLDQKKLQSINREAFSTLLWKLDREFIRRKDGAQIANLLIPFFDFINFLRVTEVPTLPISGLEKYFEDKGLVAVVTMLEEIRVRGRENLSGHELADFLDDIRPPNDGFIAEPRKPSSASTPSCRPGPERNGPSPENPSPAARVFSLDEADRKRFIKKIFKQDEEGFTSALDKLQNFSHWKDASRAIDEIFISQVIDPYSSDAIRFLEVLYKQYHPT